MILLKEEDRLFTDGRQKGIFMKDALTKLRNLFFYCGLSKEEYDSVKQQAYTSNYNLWKGLNIILALGYFVIAVFVYLNKGRVATSIPSIMCIYMLAMSFCFFLFLLNQLLLSFLIHVVKIDYIIFN